MGPAGSTSLVRVQGASHVDILSSGYLLKAVLAAAGVDEAAPGAWTMPG